MYIIYSANYFSLVVRQDLVQIQAGGIRIIKILILNKMMGLFSSLNKLSEPRDTIKNIDMDDFYEKTYKDSKDHPECKVPFASLRDGKIYKVYNNKDYTAYLIHWIPKDEAQMMQIKMKKIDEKIWSFDMSYILT